MSDNNDEDDFYFVEENFSDDVTHTLTDPINAHELHSNALSPAKTRRVKFAESHLSISTHTFTGGGGTPLTRGKNSG